MKIKALCATVFVGMVCFSSGSFAACSAIGSKNYTFEPANSNSSQCTVGSSFKSSAPPIYCHVDGASPEGSTFILLSFTDHLVLRVDGKDQPLAAGMTLRVTPNTQITLIDKNITGLGQATLINNSPEKISFICDFHPGLATATEKN